MVISRNRAKLFNSHGRIETSQSRMIVIGILWSSTSIESRRSTSMAAYLSDVNVGEGDDAIKLADLLTAR
jgi:hypothetical protein